MLSLVHNPLIIICPERDVSKAGAAMQAFGRLLEEGYAGTGRAAAVPVRRDLAGGTAPVNRLAGGPAPSTFSTDFI